MRDVRRSLSGDDAERTLVVGECLRVELALNPEGKPAAGTDIALRLVLEGDLDEAQRAELLRIATRCPMHRLLTGEVRIHTRLG